MRSDSRADWRPEWEEVVQLVKAHRRELLAIPGVREIGTTSTMVRGVPSDHGIAIFVDFRELAHRKRIIQQVRDVVGRPDLRVDVSYSRKVNGRASAGIAL